MREAAPRASALTRAQIEDRVVAILSQLVPDVDVRALPADIGLREKLAVDSIDVLNFVTALHEAFAVDVPEQDYPKLDTLDGCVGYLLGALAQAT